MSKKIQEGDLIVFGKCKKNKANYCEVLDDITIGKLYKVFNWDGWLAFTDNDGDVRTIEDFNGFANITKIVS